MLPGIYGGILRFVKPFTERSEVASGSRRQPEVSVARGTVASGSTPLRSLPSLARVRPAVSVNTGGLAVWVVAARELAGEGADHPFGGLCLLAPPGRSPSAS